MSSISDFHEYKNQDNNTSINEQKNVTTESGGRKISPESGSMAPTNAKSSEVFQSSSPHIKANVDATSASKEIPTTTIKDQTGIETEDGVAARKLFDEDTPIIKPEVKKKEDQPASGPISIKDHPANWGELDCPERLDQILSNSKYGSWLITSDERGRPQISVKNNDGSITTTRLNKQTVEDLEKMYGKDKAFTPSMQGYDRQVQFNLGSGRLAAALQYKGGDKFPTSTIDLRTEIGGVKTDDKTTELKDTLKSLSHKSRIYIIGHCTKGASEIKSDFKSDKKTQDELTVQNIVDMLLEHAPQLKKDDDGEKIKISLAACYGGKDGENGQVSFAEQLSKALDKAGIPAVVIGRTDYMERLPSNATPATFRGKFVGDRRHHHFTGDKVAVTTKNGVTTSPIVKYIEPPPKKDVF